MALQARHEGRQTGTCHRDHRSQLPPALIFRTLKRAVTGGPVFALALHLVAADGARILRLRVPAAETEFDLVAFDGSLERSFAKSSVVGACQALALLDEVERRRAATGVEYDVERPFPGDVGGKAQGRGKKQ